MEAYWRIYASVIWIIINSIGGSVPIRRQAIFTCYNAELSEIVTNI